MVTFILYSLESFEYVLLFKLAEFFLNLKRMLGFKGIDQ
jgi:hypothetical protein